MSAPLYSVEKRFNNSLDTRTNQHDVLQLKKLLMILHTKGEIITAFDLSVAVMKRQVVLYCFINYNPWLGACKLIVPRSRTPVEFLPIGNGISDKYNVEFCIE